MKTITERIQHRMRKDRKHILVSFTLPDDAIEELKEIAPTLGFTNYTALMRAYVGDGLRRDLARLDQTPIQRLTESLRDKGMSDEVIAEILTASRLQVA